METKSRNGVLWWIMGLLASLAVLLVSAVASNHSSDLREMKVRITSLEKESAANERSRQEMQRQMILVQEKLDQISVRIARW
jgi:septal ring factor EnvC (AmiA/AmiB activator)